MSACRGDVGEDGGVGGGLGAEEREGGLGVEEQWGQRIGWVWGYDPRYPQDKTWAALSEVAQPTRSRRVAHDTGRCAL